MKLLFIFIPRYKTLKNQIVKFSNNYSISYSKVDNGIIISDNKTKIHGSFFGKENLNIYGIIGKNGSGKSTVLELIIKLLGNDISLKKIPMVIGIFKNKTINFYDNDSNLNLINKTKEKIVKKFSYEDLLLKAYYETIYYTNTITGRIHFDLDINQSLVNDISTDKLLLKSIRNRGKYVSYIDEERGRYLNLISRTDSSFLSSINIPQYILYSPNKQDTRFEEYELDDQLTMTLYKFRNASIGKEYQLILFLCISLIMELGKKKVNLDYHGYQSIFDSISVNKYKDMLVELINLYNKSIKQTYNSSEIQVIKEGIIWLENTTALLSKKGADSERIINLAKLFSKLDISFYPFVVDWKFWKNGNIAYLSTGEKSILSLFSRIEELNITNHKDLLILLDEPDLGFHPAWQKGMIAKIIEYISHKFNNDISITILISSHSPFITSDLPGENVIYLGDDNKIRKTFAANIHDLLSDSFYMEDGLIGDFAKGKLQNVIAHLESKGTKGELTKDEVYAIIDMIGEPTVRGKLLDKYMSVYSIEGDDRIRLLEKEIENIKAQRNE